MTGDDHSTRICYFDLDGTLVEYDVPFSTVYKTALERDLRPAIERGWRGIYVGSDRAVRREEGETAIARERVETVSDLRELAAGLLE